MFIVGKSYPTDFCPFCKGSLNTVKHMPKVYLSSCLSYEHYYCIQYTKSDYQYITMSLNNKFKIHFTFLIKEFETYSTEDHFAEKTYNINDFYGLDINDFISKIETLEFYG